MGEKVTKAEREDRLVCETCVWFRREYADMIAPDDQNKDRGYCMHAPPLVVIGAWDTPEAVRPPVDADDYCAQWDGAR